MFCWRQLARRFGYETIDNGLHQEARWNLISWNSKELPTVATSSTETNYMTLTAAIQEVIWLKRMLSNLKVIQNRKLWFFRAIKEWLRWRRTRSFTIEQNTWISSIISYANKLRRRNLNGGLCSHHHDAGGCHDDKLTPPEVLKRHQCNWPCWRSPKERLKKTGI